MIHVFDQDFSQKVEETFHEAYMAHISTSPNYQILASLDLGRRQADLEGFELVQKQIENAMRLRDAVDNHPLLSKYMRCLTTADLIPAEPLPDFSGFQPHLYRRWPDHARRRRTAGVLPVVRRQLLRVPVARRGAAAGRQR
jgi:arginine/lysine/ornithine decarboxylase